MVAYIPMEGYLMKKELTGYPSIDKPQNNGYSFSARHPVIPNMSVYNSIQ